VKPFPSITLRPKGGIWLKLEARGGPMQGVPAD